MQTTLKPCSSSDSISSEGLGKATVKWRNKLQKIVNMASKILGKPQKQLSSLYDELIRSKAEKIISDSSHPLYSEFELLPSGKRYRLPMVRKSLYKKSFVPEAVNAINKTRMRELFTPYSCFLFLLGVLFTQQVL